MSAEALTAKWLARRGSNAAPCELTTGILHKNGTGVDLPVTSWQIHLIENFSEGMLASTVGKTLQQEAECEERGIGSFGGHGTCGNRLQEGIRISR
jgi:hypothetical protein